ncbi:unnamed protein product [Owenia fusiformis]|uniref:Chitin-binding type-2 domain-containing protein n=1 Tax=Owenia fusiformis TaxID=6347 RepID=A0A8S4PDT9_OWEFU|nr:unnamed protein product [Owenia fusiformis]
MNRMNLIDAVALQANNTMWLLPLLFSLALALNERSGKGVELDDALQALCITDQGYLSGDEAFPDDDEADCCSFVVCDAADGNKTGFLGKCMGGTVWNADLLVCDDPKYVDGCDPATCDVPKKTTALCGPLESNQCCVGGREPVFTLVDAFFSIYSVSTDGEPQFCPDIQVFNLEDCCCEYEYDEDEVCAEGPGFYYANPEDPCCSYLQCWSNKTGYDTVQCMPPSVWNDVNKTCDIQTNVMACMNVICDTPMTDAPCPPADSLEDDQCCVNGLTYRMIDNINYMLEDEQQRANCCPVDMAGEQLNFSLETCGCE